MIGRTFAVVALLATSACMNNDAAVGAGPTPAGSAVAELRDARGASVGRAVATADGAGVRVSLDAVAMPAGPHGAHVHMVGRCDAPDFTSAGAHWNPTARQHGTENPNGPHAGDMPNLTIGADGRGTLAFTLPAGSLDEMLDADGASMMIHAAADDLRTDPSGSSGGRIACGVFRRV